MKKAIKIIFMLILAVFWMVCIFKLSDMNSQKSNGKSSDIIAMFIEDTLEITNEYGITNSHPTESKLAKASNLINAPLRKVMHASVYFVLAFFIMLLLNILFNHDYYILSLIISFILCSGFAMTDEFHQTFVAGRTGQMMDVIIDSLGALVGIFFYTTYHIVYKNGYNKALEELDEIDESE